MLLQSNLREMWFLLSQTDHAFSCHARSVYDCLSLRDSQFSCLSAIELLDRSVFGGGNVSFAYYTLTTYNHTLQRCGVLRPILQEIT
jgi:hypothetical protein